MKIFAILAAVILVVNALGDEDRWNEFKIKFNKTYQTLKEHKLRYNIFRSNLRNFEIHNAKYNKGEVSYFVGVNQFADLTTEEFVKKYLSFPMLEETSKKKIFRRAVNISAVPNSIDWRDHGAVSEVKDQKKCGSCYSFSATGCLEGQNAIKYKRKVLLSNQEIVDCSRSYGNKGCLGGLMSNTFKYIKDNGISLESNYPYNARKGTCSPKTDPNVKITGYKNVATSQTALKDAVGTVGPIAAAVSAELWKSYKGGIYNEESCAGDLDHAILVAGYGTDKGTDYWLIQNSWGTRWGEKGYMRLIRNNKNSCGVEKLASFPLLV